MQMLTIHDGEQARFVSYDELLDLLCDPEQVPAAGIYSPIAGVRISHDDLGWSVDFDEAGDYMEDWLACRDFAAARSEFLRWVEEAEFSGGSKPPGTRTLHTAGYWNANGYATAIVAAVTNGCDWAAYIGGADPRREEDAYREVAQTGCKLDQRVARFFFPDVREPYRW